MRHQFTRRWKLAWDTSLLEEGGCKKLFSLTYKETRRERLQSHIWLTASSYMTKYLRISSFNRKPFLIYDFATSPLRISLYMRKILFYFLSVQKVWFRLSVITRNQSIPPPHPNLITCKKPSEIWKWANKTISSHRNQLLLLHVINWYIADEAMLMKKFTVSLITPTSEDISKSHHDEEVANCIFVYLCCKNAEFPFLCPL